MTQIEQFLDLIEDDSSLWKFFGILVDSLYEEIPVDGWRHVRSISYPSSLELIDGIYTSFFQGQYICYSLQAPYN
jgi:hypothetical protein